jgi:hypothetical protein
MGPVGAAISILGPGPKRERRHGLELTVNVELGNR